MTVAELIQRLHTLPSELPVYGIDSERDWLPLRDNDVRCRWFAKAGRDTFRDDDFFVIDDDDDNAPPNGVGIGI
jgi:hypothetical protein